MVNGLIFEMPGIEASAFRQCILGIVLSFSQAWVVWICAENLLSSNPACRQALVCAGLDAGGLHQLLQGVQGLLVKVVNPGRLAFYHQ
jgi:hypothetical protein